MPYTQQELNNSIIEMNNKRLDARLPKPAMQEDILEDMLLPEDGLNDFYMQDEVSLRHGLLLLLVGVITEGFRLIGKLFSRRVLLLLLALFFISVLAKSCTGNDGSHWLGLGVFSLLLVLVMRVYAHPDRYSLK